MTFFLFSTEVATTVNTLSLISVLFTDSQTEKATQGKPISFLLNTSATTFLALCNHVQWKTLPIKRDGNSYPNSFPEVERQRWEGNY